MRPKILGLVLLWQQPGIPRTVVLCLELTRA